MLLHRLWQSETGVGFLRFNPTRLAFATLMLSHPPRKGEDEKELAELVPVRPEGRVDAAPVLRQRGDRLAVGIVERHLQRVEIGFLAFDL